MEKEKQSKQWPVMIAILMAHILLFAGFLGLTWRCALLGRTTGVVICAVLALGALALCVLQLRREGRTGRLLGLLDDLLLLAFLLPMGLSIFLYEENFWYHHETPGAAVQQVSGYGGLRETPSPFRSDMDQLLDGAFYSKETPWREPVVILVHGNGVGHRAYLDVINAMTAEGYLVYAYDATGYDASEGNSAWGLPQGVLDLAYAIDHVRAQQPERPIALLGHSWGAYAAGAVLNVRPQVEAVVSLAGFDSSVELLEQQGRGLIGAPAALLAPYLSLYEWIKFGAWADLTASAGFAASTARVLAVHSADDPIIPPGLGYDRYLSAFADDPRFTFRLYTDRGHERLFDGAEVNRFLSRG